MSGPRVVASTSSLKRHNDDPNDAPVSIYLLRLSVASPIESTPAA